MSPPLLEYLERLAPALALAAFLATLVVAINILGRRTDRHGEWLRTLDVRVANLHKAREASRVQSLQMPPPLDAAKTVEIDEEQMLTIRMNPLNQKDEKP